MSENDKKINTTLGDVFKSTPIGDVERAMGSVFFGINHRQQPSPIPINRDMYGLTFFTRPQLNLTTQNVRAERSLIPLLTNEPASIARMIRCYLDPRLNYASSNFGCPFVDHENAFIPLLTNHLVTCAGWPDPTLDSFTSKPGSHKEVYGMVDSTLDLFAAFDLSLTFRNMQADPITEMFRIWTIYMASVFKGIMVPYPDLMMKNEIDYMTRVYRLVLDKNRNTVQKIACIGAGYPVSVPFGNSFNFDADKPLNANNDQLSFQLRSIGACYQDPIIIHEFNKVVGVFNPGMREDQFYRSGDGTLKNASVQLVPKEALSEFNCRGYPHIDPSTYELNWYVPKSEYDSVMAAYSRHNAALAR
jgi:hypothetical protein